MPKREDGRQLLGRRAESLACAYLIGRGYEIVERNARVGSKEIDVIARRGELVVFCEVRARVCDKFVSPLATIGPAKVRNIREAARRWLYERGWRGVSVRFDAAAVVFDRPAGRLDYVEGAF